MKKQIRTQQVTIDMPKEGQEVFIRAVMQKIDKDDDGNVVNVSPRQDFIYKAVKDMATEIYTFYDPILQKETSISGYGLNQAIGEALVKWTIEKFGGTRDGLDVWL